ncbi:MAG: 50S ribosomal protein L21 [Endomicrobium sp.]|jgi:large subunit ribosomal protein L21|nr:50S ribosomal protein L21 [Endomicrobium sp.]
MYAIIKTGGKQYKAEPGVSLVVEKLDKAEPGQEIVLDKVLLLANDEKVSIGRPLVEGVSVVVKVIAQRKSPKILVFKKKPKKGYKKLHGHRQYITELQVSRINSWI